MINEAWPFSDRIELNGNNLIIMKDQVLENLIYSLIKCAHCFITKKDDSYSLEVSKTFPDCFFTSELASQVFSRLAESHLFSNISSHISAYEKSTRIHHFTATFLSQPNLGI